ncbi:MAG: N-acetylmuramoyl-L-alanine amidase [Xenococcaceae cyanobacterium MO_188.B29]|nr:N-acetylmuramoyl-L-alanine amidase [Xenococcaceae cyanobacterium MO_188.B29]
MRFKWILLSFFSIFLFCSPAEAGKLLSWQFELRENRLVFITDESVQPKAQLLASPTRLVIDLPGISLGQETVKENYTGRIRSLRVGQFDEQTARIVVELSPGYTLDPQQVEFKGTSSNQWTVNLPSPRIERISSSRARLNSDNQEREPQIITIESQPSSDLKPIPRVSSFDRVRIVDTVPSEPESKDTNLPAQSSLAASSPYVKPTRNGFFIGIDGDRENRLTARRSSDRETIDFELKGVTLPADLASKTVSVEQYGVNQIEFTQTSSTQARMTLKVDPDSPDWNASFSRIRGLVLVPKVSSAGIAASRNRNIPTSTSSDSENRVTRNKITVEKIAIAENDTQLLIGANHPVAAQAEQISTGTYQITIPNAQLAAADSFTGPQLNARSPISEIRVLEKDSSVLITIQTRLGVRLGKTTTAANQLFALPIQRGLTPPPMRDNPLLSPSNRPLTIQVPQPENRTLSKPLPSRPVPRSKPLVIIDPGHGGQDPGTVGIGGLREKDIVLPISLDVAEGLRKQGIEVRMTRDSDYFVSLKGRTEFANKTDASLFVSIHANAINMSRPDVNGLETYYYQDGRRLAEVIHWSILNSINIKNRNIRRARFYVLRHSSMPAVLVEVGFVTGAEDAPRLKDPTHRSQMADAIIRGIVQYIKQKGL